MENSQLVLLLSGARGVGPRTMTEILRRNAVARRTPDEFARMRSEDLCSEYALRRPVAEAIVTALRSRLAWASATLRELDRAGTQVVTLVDASYPPRLLDVLDHPPPVLYALGPLGLLEEPLFAVANSNGAGEAALAASDRAAAVAVREGWVPVTGHNRTAYQRSALVARRNGSQLCYVMDRGLRYAFGGDLTREVFAAARIWSPSFDPSRDLALSPFGPDEHGTCGNNRRRDELVFALAWAVVRGYVRPAGRMEAACDSARSRGVPIIAADAPDTEVAAELAAATQAAR
jgi:hypothetical protein